jgi:hypothetical protein
MVIGFLRAQVIWGILATVCSQPCAEAQDDAAMRQTAQTRLTSAHFDTTTGRLTLRSNGREFAEAAFAAPGRSTCTVEPVADTVPWGPGAVLQIGPNAHRVLVREGSPFIFMRRDARTEAKRDAGASCEVLQMPLDLDADAMALKGLGPAGLFDPAANPGQHVWTAVADPTSGGGVVAGLVKIDAVSAVVTTRIESGRVVMTLRDDYGSAVPPNLDEWSGDWWAVGYFQDIRDGLEAYADEFARLQAIQLPPVPVGFMSWYSEKYGGALNEAAVTELSRYLATTFRDYGYDFVQIDDLWQNGQKRNGPAKDFTRVDPRGPYAGGMRPVAQQIRALGLRPGLWLLPFAIDHQDPILADRVPLIAHRPNGTPYETNWSGTALDLTRREARAYVQGFIRQAVHDWGFQYLKLDGLHIGMATAQTYPHRHYVDDRFGDVVFADPSQSNMQAGRAGLRAIREAAGPDTFLLGCCAPQNERSLGMAMGLLDAMRVGADSEVRWSGGSGGVVGGVQAAAALYFFNGRIWWNDPDAIYARASMPLHEVQTLASWVALTSTLNNQTDWAPDYPAERVELLRRTMPAHQLTSVRPVDLLEHDPARVWVLTYDVTGQRHAVVGLFNWSDADALISCSLEPLGLGPDAPHSGFDFWSKQLTPVFTRELSLPVPARTCRIIAVREHTPHPIVLSTSRHVTQGATDLVEEHWDGARRTLSGASRAVGQDPYELRLLSRSSHASTANWHAKRVTLAADDVAAGATADIDRQTDLTVVRIQTPVSRTIRWSVEYE